MPDPDQIELNYYKEHTGKKNVVSALSTTNMTVFVLLEVFLYNSYLIKAIFQLL